MKALVSVVMPAYNCARYISQAIHSILDQSYSNFELLIWDDGSTDGTVEQIKMITDSRIVLYRNYQNKGYPDVMNSLFDVAGGDFVMIQDADDWAHTHRIEKLIEAITNNPGFDLVGSRLIKFYPNGKYQNVYSELVACKLNDSFIQYSRPDIVFGTLLMRRNVTKTPFRNLMFITRAHDIDWLFRVSENHQLMNCSEHLYYYRHHGQSMSNANKREHLYNYFFWEYICFISRFRREKGIDLLQSAYGKELIDFLNTLIKKKKNVDPIFWERHLAYRARRNGNWFEAVSLALSAIKLHPFKKVVYQCLYKILSRSFR